MKDLESGKERPLTESPAKEISPRISPDGSLVSYAIRTTGPVSELKTSMSFRQKEGWSRSSATDAASPGAGSQTISFSFTAGSRTRAP